MTITFTPMNLTLMNIPYGRVQAALMSAINEYNDEHGDGAIYFHAADEEEI